MAKENQAAKKAATANEGEKPVVENKKPDAEAAKPEVEEKLIECTVQFQMVENGELYAKGDPIKVTPARFKSLGDAVRKAD